MTWPTSQDYNEAIQDPRVSLGDPELRSGQAVVNSLGIPMPRTGNFADVYEFRCPNGNVWALKCFTKEIPGLRERYSEISKHLAQANLPFMVDFQYLERGIRVHGKWYPLLKMRWVNGFLLNQFVRDNLDKKHLLEGLRYIWLRMALRLREARTAHADLQHGNVILIPGSKAGSVAVKLIDYDGMCVPALERKPSGESGHPAYQHPRRGPEKIYSFEVDRFPLLAGYCALRALEVVGRPLWERYDTGDNLLFLEKDFRHPGQSKLVKELWQVPDAMLHDLVGYVVLASQGPLAQTPLLDQVVDQEQVAPLSASRENQLTAMLGPGATVSRRAIPVAAAPRQPQATSDFDFAPNLPNQKPGRKSAVRQAHKRARTWLWASSVLGVALLGFIVALAGGIFNRAQVAPRPGSPKPPTKMPSRDGVSDNELKRDRGREVVPAPHPEPIARKTVLVINTNVSGAEVYVDDEKVTVPWVNDGKSGQIEIKPGTHKVEVKKVGFAPKEYLLTLEEGQKLAREAILERIARDTVLVIKTNEPEPDVYVDGKNMAVTWDIVSKRGEIEIKPGTYKVEVKKVGFITAATELTLEEGIPFVFPANLEPFATVPDFIKALRHANADIRHAAAVALSEIGPKAADAVSALVAAEAVFALVQVVGDDRQRSRTRVEAAMALHRIGPVPAAIQAVPTLVKILKDSSQDAKVREHVLRSLRVHSDNLKTMAGVYPALTKILGEARNDHNKMLRYDSAHLLGMHQRAKVLPEVLGVLLEYLKDDNVPVFDRRTADGAELGKGDGRTMAIKALTAIGANRLKEHGDIIQQLRTLASNEAAQTDVREGCKMLLNGLNAATGLPKPALVPQPAPLPVRSKTIGDLGKVATTLDLHQGAVIDVDAKTALLFLARGKVKRYSYPEFKPSGTYMLDHGTAFGPIYDKDSGRLFVLEPAYKSELAESLPDKMRRGIQVTVYQIRDLLNRKLKNDDKDAKVKASKTISLEGKCSHLCLSPDGAWLYALDQNNYPKEVKVVRVNLATEKIDEKKVDMPDSTFRLSLARDGKTLYALSGDPAFKAKRAILAIDAEDMVLKKPINLPVDPFDLVTTKEGVVFVSGSGNKASEITILDVRTGKVEATWKGVPAGSRLKLSEDEKCLFVGKWTATASKVCSVAVPDVFSDSTLPPEKWAKGRLFDTHGEMMLTQDNRFLLCDSGDVFSLGR
jgi:HEAT repeat protein